MMHIRRVPGRAYAGPSQGFTLIELMIAVAIVGVLSAIAFPFYEEHITKTRRAEAKAALMSAAAAFERYKAANNFSYEGACFTGEDCDNEIVNGNVPEDGAGPFYTLTSARSADGRQFRLVATATSAWSGRDGALVITHTGARGWTDKHGDDYPCWPQGSTADCAAGSLPTIDD